MKTKLSLKGRGLQWLAQREHSRAELRTKLLRVARSEAEAATHDTNATPTEPTLSPGDAVDATLAWLEAHHYLSDTRFAESRVHARAGRYGNLRIRQELAQHGVTLSADDAAALRSSELARARDVWQRRFGVPAQDPAERARQLRFLGGRGFSPDVIRLVVRGAPDPDAD